MGSFFENAMVKVGRLNATVPVVLYYNPLLDVALFTLWLRQGNAIASALMRDALTFCEGSLSAS